MLEEVFPGLAHVPNVHPLFVHFPIALWVTAVLFLFLGIVRRREELFTAGRWLLYLGALGAALAVGTGLWAADAMGHDSPGHELVHVHRDFMLVASGLGGVATIAAFVLRTRQSTGVRWGIIALAVATVGVLTLGVDRGAALVFRYGIGTAVQSHSEAEGVNRNGNDADVPGPDVHTHRTHAEHEHEHDD